ncbi:transporter [Chryseosolibacter indicus]|uniref:Transporter n=1 Tax=Chryseosolibacter indicus TaxID=2782351 RepID=A0ABS5VSN2_9BACT|nr:transporter [Chryseosolibacter indicus]MBT1704417.1 hypothetical protein [Chryseosolibacter indicus]
MKRYIYTTIIILTFTSDVFACNTCGCGVANYHYGILPQFQKNFLGIRYRYRSYVSQLEEGHFAPYSYETFQSTELWGRFYPVNRMQVFLFVPFNFNERKEGDKITHLNGLGDIVISANYNLINTYDSADTQWKHNLLIGGGVKLPTGQFQKVEDGLTVNQNFQLGTGSTDLLFNIIYTLRYKKAGLNTEFTYNYNTTNRDKYRFGNTTRSSITAFYVPTTGGFTIMPNAGVSMETFQDNRQYNQPFEDTGGWAMFYNMGVESYYRNFAFGISYTHPGKQKLFSEKVTANDRVSVHLTFMF